MLEAGEMEIQPVKVEPAALDEEPSTVMDMSEANEEDCSATISYVLDTMMRDERGRVRTSWTLRSTYQQRGSFAS